MQMIPSFYECDAYVFFLMFRCKNLPDTSGEICVDAGLSEFMRVMLYLGQNSHLLIQTFLAWRFAGRFDYV